MVLTPRGQANRMTRHRTEPTHAPQREASWHASALILLAAAMSGLIMPNAASAGCGDYVLVNGKPLSTLRQESAVAPSLREILTKSDSLPRSPCHGPHCGRQLPLPVPAQAPVPTQPTGEQWGLALANSTAADLPWALLLLELPISFPDGSLLPIERPPRRDGR